MLRRMFNSGLLIIAVGACVWGLPRPRRLALPVEESPPIHASGEEKKLQTNRALAVKSTPRAEKLPSPTPHEVPTPSIDDKGSIFDLIAVVDGDTLRIDFRGKPTYVRLLRINTPEVGRRGYKEATESLRALVGEGPVRIVFEIPGRIETDHYGRLLAYVYVGDLNVNLEIVRRGWSKFWPIFGEGRFANSFRKAQEEAQKATAGLWGRTGKR